MACLLLAVASGFHSPGERTAIDVHCLFLVVPLPIAAFRCLPLHFLVSSLPLTAVHCLSGSTESYELFCLLSCGFIAGPPAPDRSRAPPCTWWTSAMLLRTGAPPGAERSAIDDAWLRTHYCD